MQLNNGEEHDINSRLADTLGMVSSDENINVTIV